MLFLVLEAGECACDGQQHAAECHAQSGHPVHAGLRQGILHSGQDRVRRQDRSFRSRIIRGGVLHGRQLGGLRGHNGLVLHRRYIGVFRSDGGSDRRDDYGFFAIHGHFLGLDGGEVVVHMGLGGGFGRLGDGRGLHLVLGAVGVGELALVVGGGAGALEDVADDLGKGLVFAAAGALDTVTAVLLPVEALLEGDIIGAIITATYRVRNGVGLLVIVGVRGYTQSVIGRADIFAPTFTVGEVCLVIEGLLAGDLLFADLSQIGEP